MTRDTDIKARTISKTTSSDCLSEMGCLARKDTMNYSIRPRPSTKLTHSMRAAIKEELIRAHPAISHCSHLLLKCRVATNIIHWLKVLSRWFKNYICEKVYFDQLLAFIIGITHVFHALTFAGSRGSCLNTRPLFSQRGGLICAHAWIFI